MRLRSICATSLMIFALGQGDAFAQATSEPNCNEWTPSNFYTCFAASCPGMEKEGRIVQEVLQKCLMAVCGTDPCDDTTTDGKFDPQKWFQCLNRRMEPAPRQW